MLFIKKIFVILNKLINFIKKSILLSKNLKFIRLIIKLYTILIIVVSFF